MLAFVTIGLCQVVFGRESKQCTKKELPIYDVDGKPIPGGGTGTGFRLYNPTYRQWMFVSSDVSTRYNINSKQIAANIAWLSQNAASVYTEGVLPPKLPNIDAQGPEALSDLIVESHSNADEQRNYFFAIPVKSVDGCLPICCTILPTVK